MSAPLGILRSVRSALANGVTTPKRLAEAALSHANQSPNANTYLWQDPGWTLAEAERAEAMPGGQGGAFGDGRPVLWGVPVAVKDCFDLAGSPTTCGTKFYREKNGIAERDSWVVERLRAAGAVITGKAHLHAIAYGITGENPEFGDALQPGNPGALTGGSSSGSAMSVMEGSAVAAVGTDTGGSVRVPAALCGLAGYRASLGRGDWRGGFHLAESFDTLGWLFSDLEEAPLLGSFFAPREMDPAAVGACTRFATVGSDFLFDLEPEVAESYRRTVFELEALGLQRADIEVSWWADAVDIMAPIQASEAAALHAGSFNQLEPVIRDRLAWGASFTTPEIADLRVRHGEFRARMDEVFAAHDLVMLPAAPVAKLRAGADHSKTRARLLRYTAPFSLAGVPAVTIPCAAGGMQMAAAREQDEALLQITALLAAKRKARPTE